MNVADKAGDFVCRTKEELEVLIREGALGPYDDIWISGEGCDYPCLAILVNGKFACVHYFLNDCGDVWQSVGNHDGDVIFAANGEAPEVMPGNCVVSLDVAVECANLFFEVQERPGCIEWREL